MRRSRVHLLLILRCQGAVASGNGSCGATISVVRSVERDDYLCFQFI